MIRYLFILFLITSCKCSICQDLCFVNYNSQNGLPSSQVYDMFQDKNGEMWFATDRGIVKYDGFEFKPYDISNGLTSNTIFDFYPQKDGKVWCSTINNSWFYFMNGEDTFIKYEFSDTLQKYSNNFLCDDMVITNNGNIKISFENYYGYIEINSLGKIVTKLNQLEYKKQTVHCVQVKSENQYFHYYQLFGENKNNKLVANAKFVIANYDKLGYKKASNVNSQFLFSTHKTLYKYISVNKQIEYSFNNVIIGIGKYDSNHIWIGFKGDGVRIYDMNMVEKAHYLPNDNVTNLYRDKSDGIWISTLYNGVYYARNDKIKKINSDKELFVYQIVLGKNDQIIFSTNKTEIYFLQNNELHQTDFTNKYKEALKFFYDPRTDSYETSVKNVKSDNFIFKDRVYSIIDVSENRNKNTLIGSSRAILMLDKSKEFIKFETSQRINCVEYAQNGFFYGTSSGIYYLDTLRKTESKLSNPEFQYRITDIKYIDGCHFIGTSGNGVLRYHQASNRIDKISTKEGLSSNIINEIFVESKKCAWIATNNGVNRLTFKKNKCSILSLNHKNGLPNDEITDILKLDDIIWIGTSNGLIKFNSTDLHSPAKSIDLNLYWKEIHFNSKTISIEDIKDLPYYTRNLKFDFHLAYFGGNKNVQIRYKLVGIDTEWNYTDGLTIIFNNLSPGKYKLLLQVKAEESKWTDNQIWQSFKINKPYYSTWWFISIIIILIGILIYYFFRIRVLIYNKDLVRELLRIILRKLKPKTNSFVIWSQGNEIRISSNDVLYFKAIGNYLEIVTIDKKYVFRYKIGEIDSLVPDKLEYKRVHRSFVVRLDKISGKNSEDIDVQGYAVPIGKTYKSEVKNLDID